MEVIGFTGLGVGVEDEIKAVTFLKKELIGEQFRRQTTGRSSGRFGAIQHTFPANAIHREANKSV